MTAVQAHRGPDDSGLWEKRFPDGAYVGLGSRRLAIIDLSPSGHMPMCNEDGTVWITYNGEVYNFAELRRELGLAFKIEVDGGIAHDTVAQVVKAGAELLVAGNAVFGRGKPEQDARRLLKAAKKAAKES